MGLNLTGSERGGAASSILGHAPKVLALASAVSLVLGIANGGKLVHDVNHHKPYGNSAGGTASTLIAAGAAAAMGLRLSRQRRSAQHTT